MKKKYIIISTLMLSCVVLTACSKIPKIPFISNNDSVKEIEATSSENKDTKEAESSASENIDEEETLENDLSETTESTSENSDESTPEETSQNMEQNNTQSEENQGDEDKLKLILTYQKFYEGDYNAEDFLELQKKYKANTEYDQWQQDFYITAIDYTLEDGTVLHVAEEQSGGSTQDFVDDNGNLYYWFGSLSMDSSGTYYYIYPAATHAPISKEDRTKGIVGSLADMFGLSDEEKAALESAAVAEMESEEAAEQQ